MSFTSDSRTKRLLDLVVVLLDAKQPIPFSELREQFQEYRTVKPEAGLRAFERDKATLLELGVPIRWLGPEEGNDLPPEGGYQIDRQRYRLPEVTLSADEVAALVVTAAAARHQPEFPYRHAAELAVRKLMFDLAGLGGQGRGRGGMPRDVLVHMPSTYRSRSLTEHLGALEEAVRHRKRVTLQYDHHRPPQEMTMGSAPSAASTPRPRRAAAVAESDGVPQPMAAQSSEKWEAGAPSEAGGPQHSTREVDPYGLVYRHGAWLLVGHCHVARAVRRFRVDRILDLKVAPRPRTPDFEVPREFSLQEHGSFSPWRFQREPGVAVRLWVSGATPWVAEEDFGPCARAPFAGGALEEGGEALPPGILVDFTCGNLDYLVSRVLGGAGALRVLSPETLRRRIADTAGAVARRLSGLDLR